MNVETVATDPRTAEIPDESWSFDRLADFCGLMCRRLATDAWLIGRAFAVVKAKLKHGRWLPWVKKNCPGLSRGTANRYMQLAERLTLDEVQEHGLTECYRRAGIVAAPPTDGNGEPPTGVTINTGVSIDPPPVVTIAPPSEAASPRVWQKPATPGTTGPPSWAVKDPFSPEIAGTGDDRDEVLPESEAFREEVDDRLPLLLASLDDALGWLLARWDTLGRSVDAAALAARVVSVRDKLSGLADRLAQPVFPVLEVERTGLTESEPTLAM